MLFNESTSSMMVIIKIHLTIHVIELTSNFDIESRATRVAIDDDDAEREGEISCCTFNLEENNFFPVFFKLKL